MKQVYLSMNTPVMILVLVLAIGCGCPLFPVSPAYGEPAAELSGTYELESVTVTAGKKEEQLQEMPASVDVVSDVEMEDAGMEDLFDLTRFSPNVHMKQNYTEHVIVIRGIPSFRASTHSPAGLYVDDVSYPLHYMQNITLFDVEQAEILKGPQGTLYGRNTESGVIHIRTRRPGNRFQGRVFGEYGSYNTLRSGAGISGPLVPDTLFLSGGFQYRASDGYIDNIADGNDRAADLDALNGRTSLRWIPTTAWDVSLIADAVSADNHIGGYRLVNGPDATRPFEASKDEDEYYDEEGNSQVLRVKYSGDSFDFLSVSGLLHQELDKLADTDLTSDPANRIRNEFRIRERMFSQELRISSPGNGVFEWLGGVYGFTEESDFDYRLDLVSKGIVGKHPIADIDTEGYAVFGQGTYSPLAQLHLTAGLRLDHQALTGFLQDRAKGSQCSGELAYDEALPKFSAAYDVTETVMVYAASSRGYLAGGFNWLMNPVAQTFDYGPEYSWNHELGIKTAWLNGRLVANLSLFYTDIEDKQVTEYDADTSLNRVTNAAQAHSRGLEFQVRALPVPGVEFFAGIGLNESEFDEFQATEWNDARTALVEQDYGGNRLPYAPEYTCNAGIQYRSPSGFFGRADLLGTGRFYGDAANTAEQDAYWTMNLRLGYETESWDAGLWVENVWDESFLTYVAPFNSSSHVGLDGAPRTVGIRIAWRF